MHRFFVCLWFPFLTILQIDSNRPEKKSQMFKQVKRKKYRIFHAKLRSSNIYTYRYAIIEAYFFVTVTNKLNPLIQLKKCGYCNASCATHRQLMTTYIQLQFFFSHQIKNDFLLSEKRWKIFCKKKKTSVWYIHTGK